jgi:hypothetical protein
MRSGFRGARRLVLGVRSVMGTMKNAFTGYSIQQMLDRLWEKKLLSSYGLRKGLPQPSVSVHFHFSMPGLR